MAKKKKPDVGKKSEAKVTSFILNSCSFVINKISFAKNSEKFTSKPQLTYFVCLFADKTSLTSRCRLIIQKPLII